MKRIKNLLLSALVIFGLTLVPLTTSAASYTIAKGDTLYSISQKFGTSIDNLMKYNGLTSTMINAGGTLLVDSKTHIVKSGDTLFKIAKQYGVTLSEIRSLNNKYDDLITVGQIINIPKSATSVPVVAAPTSKFTESEIDLLARLIMAEAEGEEYQAKVAVGAVVINRLNSKDWPNTLSGVIYQNINGYYQFSPVANGTIKKAANADSIRAAKEAMSGIDPTNGAMFYYDTSSTNTWIRSKPVSVSIDNMVFAY